MRPPRVKGPSDDPLPISPAWKHADQSRDGISWYSCLRELYAQRRRGREKGKENFTPRTVKGLGCLRPQYYRVQPLLPWFFNLYRHIFAQMTEMNDWLQGKNVKHLLQSLHKGNYWYEWATIASITTLRKILKLRQFIFSSARLVPSRDLLTPPPLPFPHEGEGHSLLVCIEPFHFIKSTTMKTNAFL